MRLSLICPTIGRSTLARLMDSVFPQMKPGDEFIVVGDGPQPAAFEIIRNHVSHSGHGHLAYYETPTKTGDYGCTPADYGVTKAQGDAVFFIGDDDVLDPNAFAVIRAALEGAPNVPHLFAMMHTGRRLGNTLRCCAVSGQQIVIPRNMAWMPKMAEVPPHQMGVSDWVFIDKVHRAWGGQTVFHDEVIAHMERQNSGRML